MSDLNFKLEVFEGPLDLLLTLIAKHKLDIKDIEITKLLEQFMLYLERMAEADMEVTSDFLEMAARLIHIKSAAFLPKHEVEQLKKELEGILIEYALCKAVAAKLKARYVGDGIFTRETQALEDDKLYLGSASLSELVKAYMALSRRRIVKAQQKEPSVEAVIPHSYATVYSKIIYVLKRLNRVGELKMQSLYRGLSRSDGVAVFLAVLELARLGRLEVSDDGQAIVFTGRKSPMTVG